MRVYTRTGDDGSTGLGDGSRVSKSALRVAAYGHVDELNAALGVLACESLPAPADGHIRRLQVLLFDIGAFLADPSGRRELPEEVAGPSWLENWIDDMSAHLPPVSNFVVPGGTRAAALAHFSRTICRRAERRVVELAEAGEDVGAALPFLNRTSDALFVCARWLNHTAGERDVLWQSGR